MLVRAGVFFIIANLCAFWWFSKKWYCNFRYSIQKYLGRKYPTLPSYSKEYSIQRFVVNTRLKTIEDWNINMRTIYRNRKIMLLNNVTQTSVTYFSHANTTRLIVKTVQLSLLGRERNTYFNSCLKAVLMNWCSFRIISRFYTCMYVRLQLSVTYLCLVKIPSKVSTWKSSNIPRNEK